MTAHRVFARHFVPAVALVVLAAPPLVQAQAPAAGKKYAVLVGVKDYDHDKLKPLGFPENDVEELARLLRPAGYEVVVLTNTEGRRDPNLAPTLANINARLAEVVKKCKRQDLVLVCLTGHGLQFEKVKETDPDDAYFCPRDARPFVDDRETLLSLKALYLQLDRSGAGVKMLMVDACREEVTGRGKGVNGSTSPRPPSGTVALFSCKGGERSWECDRLKHGVFFHYVLEGLRGQAKNDDGEVTWDRLQEYVRRRVSRDVAGLVGPDVRQTPTHTGETSGESPVLLAGKAGVPRPPVGDPIKVPTDPPPPPKVGDRVRVTAQTSGFEDTKRTPSLRAPVVREDTRGQVIKIDKANDLCQIRLGKPAGVEVWVDLNLVVVE